MLKAVSRFSSLPAVVTPSPAPPEREEDVQQPTPQERRAASSLLQGLAVVLELLRGHGRESLESTQALSDTPIFLRTLCSFENHMLAVLLCPPAPGDPLMFARSLTPIPVGMYVVLFGNR